MDKKIKDLKIWQRIAFSILSLWVLIAAFLDSTFDSTPDLVSILIFYLIFGFLIIKFYYLKTETQNYWRTRQGKKVLKKLRK